jgi:hypothetical protein
MLQIVPLWQTHFSEEMENLNRSGPNAAAPVVNPMDRLARKNLLNNNRTVSGDSLARKGSIHVVPQSPRDSFAMPTTQRLSDSQSIFGFANRPMAVGDPFQAFLRGFGIDPIHFPLLNPILRTSYPENAVTCELAGRPREILTAELIYKILSGASKKFYDEGRKLLFILDDVQWMDSGSWALFLRLQEFVKTLLLCFISRPAVDYNLTQLQKLIGSKEARVVKLGGVGFKDVEAILLGCFQDVAHDPTVNAVSNDVVTKILEKSGGNPLWIRNYAVILFEKRLVVPSHDAAQRLDADRGANLSDTSALGWASSESPKEFDNLSGTGDEISSIILTQFDKLDQVFSDLLKAASCIDERFSLLECLVAFDELAPEEATAIDDEELSARSKHIVSLIENHDRFHLLERIDQPSIAQVTGESTEKIASRTSFVQASTLSVSGGPIFYKFRHIQVRTAVRLDWFILFI